MTTRACPFCAEEIQAAAVKCKHCGSDVTPVAPVGSDSKEPVGTSGKRWPWIVGAVVGVTILASVISSGGDDKADAGSGRSSDAKYVCEKSVKDQLKAPATAKFTGATATLGAGDRWTVTGSVDSQNSFGALVRTAYTCSAIHGTGENWRTKSILLN